MTIAASRRILSLTVAALLMSLASAGASPPGGQYIVGGAAPLSTVYDTKTKLTWERATTDLLTADFAKARCASLGSGWRLPTIKELFTIVDYTVALPGALIDAQAFPQTPAGTFWTTLPKGTEAHQCVDFSSGRNGCSPDQNLSRCVR